jgi:endo-1,4-beta-D-glucanase Y
MVGSGGASSGGTTGSGGTSGLGGASNDAGAGDATDAATDLVASCQTARGPATKQTGMSFPFPQNRENSRCTYPVNYCNDDVQAAYAQWKADTVTNAGAPAGRRVKRPNEPGLEKDSTVSEGIGYGMLIAVYMNDQSLFDDLWLYEQKFVDGKSGLMNWYIKADGSGIEMNPSGAGPATDADEDMAFALVMADKQWGGKGGLAKNYIDIAKDTIGAIWANEIFQSKYIRPGAWGDNSATNLSYFAPAYYRLFAKVDTANASNWMTVIDTMYDVLNNKAISSGNGNQTNGLVPAWCDASGKPNGGAFGPTGGASPTNYQYDSCRTPFRIGLDWCWNGEARAQTYVTLTSNFFSGKTVAKMVDGYDLNGTDHPEQQKDSNAQEQSSAFIGPAGVGAMNNVKYQSFVNDAYAAIAARKALVGGTYYDDSWMVMSLLMMTGNFLDYTTY